jgi:endonuclease G
MTNQDDRIVIESSHAGIQRIATEPKPPAFFKGREGYASGFLGDGFVVDLPELRHVRQEDIARLSDGSIELKYEHFSTVHCIPRKVPFFSACNVNGSQARNVPRHDTWNYDGRIPKEHQLLRGPYGPQEDRKFSRGHMTRRQDPNWGPLDTAKRANIDTFFATNACPQWQPFNDVAWGDLEDYILENAKGDEKLVSVFTGPFLADSDPERHGVKIPRDFWKVVAFVSEATGKPASISYVVSQGRYLDTGVVRDFEDFQMAQRPLGYVESRSGLVFNSLTGTDVFAGASLETVQPIRWVHDTRLPVR